MVHGAMVAQTHTIKCPASRKAGGAFLCAEAWQSGLLHRAYPSADVWASNPLTASREFEPPPPVSKGIGAPEARSVRQVRCSCIAPMFHVEATDREATHKTCLNKPFPCLVRFYSQCRPPNPTGDPATISPNQKNQNFMHRVPRVVGL
jgi:hypothetical protein